MNELNPGFAWRQPDNAPKAFGADNLTTVSLTARQTPAALAASFNFHFAHSWNDRIFATERWQSGRMRRS
jgi:hypothetical protein